MPAAVSGCLSMSARNMAIQQQQRAPPRALPVINLAGLGDKDPAASTLVIQDIAQACRDRGCFQVINHGVSKSVMNGALEAATEFFELPAEQKQEFASDDIRHPIRYDKFKGWDQQGQVIPQALCQSSGKLARVLANAAINIQKMGKYAFEIQRLSVLLMGAIAQGLGLEPLDLQEKLEEGLQFMVLNNYPQSSSQAGDKVGLAPHSDYGFLTILLQSSPGLEVMHHDDDAWTPVPVIPGALHVHLGDNLEVLSNGRLRSLVHRAILNPDESRISIASIHGFSMDEKVDCAEELVDENHQKMYRASSFQHACPVHERT